VRDGGSISFVSDSVNNILIKLQFFNLLGNAATIASTVQHMHHYGFSEGEHKVSFGWLNLKEARDKYILRLNSIYENSMESNGIISIIGTASFPDKKTLREGDAMKKVHVTNEINNEKTTYLAKHVLIATGARPIFPEGDGIFENSLSSDGFFELNELPKKVVIVGAGYIGVELAGILQALGTDTSLVIRKKNILSRFDEIIYGTLEQEMTKQGIKIYKETGGVHSITKSEQGEKSVLLKNGLSISGVDCVIMATGRGPNIERLNLSGAGIQQQESGHIQVNEYSETSVDGIYALGDVCGKVELTPMV